MTGDDKGSAESGWDDAYGEDRAPWDLGRPQQAWLRVVHAEQVASPVLDSGCGTEEHALLLAESGCEVGGIDISSIAIDRARAKAAARALSASFEVNDVLTLDRLGREFATIIDSGVFHAFDDAERRRYVQSLAGALDTGGVLHLMCFSEQEPGDAGPRRNRSCERPSKTAGRLSESSPSGSRYARTGLRGRRMPGWRGSSGPISSPRLSLC
ncbi:MAG: class I SAM-dependent methyltransferase [Acidimicrobiia bacterium]